jgi:hypothetical protein
MPEERIQPKKGGQNPPTPNTKRPKPPSGSSPRLEQELKMKIRILENENTGLKERIQYLEKNQGNSGYWPGENLGHG